MMTLARLIPGFGGLYVTTPTRGGRPDNSAPVHVTVYLRSLAQRNRAERLIAVAFKAHSGRSRSISGFTFLQATYTFEELREWKRRLWMNLASNAVTFVATDLRRPRVLVGARGDAGAATVRQALARLGVPREAVDVQVSGSLELQQGSCTTLLSECRPVPGAVQVTRQPTTACSLGFNVAEGGRRRFITVSHCSSSFWAVDNSVFGQPVSSVIATGEYRDLGPWYPPECPVNIDGCRHSESTMVTYSSDNLAELGTIAKPNGTFGVMEIDPNTPRFTILGKKWDFVTNDVIDKVGRSTGWTFGYVADPCAYADFPRDGRRYGLICQVLVDYSADPGDSGGPTFVWYPNNSVDIAGIHVGQVTISTTGLQYRFFSRFNEIACDLGSCDLTVW